MRRLVDEVPVNQIAREFTSENYEVTVADIGRLQEESAYLASMNAVMCERMGWADMQVRIALPWPDRNSILDLGSCRSDPISFPLFFHELIWRTRP